MTIRAAAVEMDMTFRHLSVADGLSQNTVLTVEQDKLGNIWFGTQNGINVYDARIAAGRSLARSHPVAADLITGVPESGIPAAKGYSMESGIPLRRSVI